MITKINGKVRIWPNTVAALWAATENGRPGGVVLEANYYTPRPYRNEYDRGSMESGFVYTIGVHVYEIKLDFVEKE